MRLRRPITVSGVAPVLKPRYTVWLSAVYPRLVPAVIVLIFAVQEGAPVLIPLSLVVLVMLALGFTPLAWAIWRERKHPPTILRFWDHCAGFELEVRRLHTGEVLIRRQSPHLDHANLRRVRLSGADLRGVSLRSAKGRRADLRGADLRGCGLSAADLRDADLRCAKLNGACLSGARFCGANLCGADLRGAELTDARNLDDADFSGARYDETTRWPAGFDPERRRCRLMTSGGGRLPIPATHPPVDREGLPLPVSTDAAETQVNRIGREHL